MRETKYLNTIGFFDPWIVLRFAPSNNYQQKSRNEMLRVCGQNDEVITIPLKFVLLPQEAEAVEADEDGAAFVEDHGDP